MELEPLYQAPEPAAQEAPARPSLRRRARLMAALIFLLILMAVNMAIGSGKVQFEKVISASMEPNLMTGDVILSDANAPPKRYDIICLNSPETKGEKLVKRIIGIPGDIFRIQDHIIYLNGKEEYSKEIPENAIEWGDTRIKIPEGCVFVLGDNRNNSHDSLNYGPVPYKNIRGVVNFIVWPPKRLGQPKALH